VAKKGFTVLASRGCVESSKWFHENYFVTAMLRYIVGALRKGCLCPSSQNESGA
jgi:hypothetical protein